MLYFPAAGVRQLSGQVSGVGDEASRRESRRESRLISHRAETSARRQRRRHRRAVKIASSPRRGYHRHAKSAPSRRTRRMLVEAAVAAGWCPWCMPSAPLGSAHSMRNGSAGNAIQCRPSVATASRSCACERRMAAGSRHRTSQRRMALVGRSQPAEIRHVAPQAARVAAWWG